MKTIIIQWKNQDLHQIDADKIILYYRETDSLSFAALEKLRGLNVEYRKYYTGTFLQEQFLNIFGEMKESGCLKEYQDQLVIVTDETFPLQLPREISIVKALGKKRGTRGAKTTKTDAAKAESSIDPQKKNSKKSVKKGKEEQEEFTEEELERLNKVKEMFS